MSLIQQQGHNSRMEKVIEPKIELGLRFMVTDLEYKFQMKENLSY
jgi:hypothetical protein